MDRVNGVRKAPLSYLTTNTLPSSGSRFVYGKGVMITDDSGKTYVDLCSSTLNMALGHQHPDVTRAVSDQISKIWFVPTAFNNPAFFELGKLLTDLAPEGVTSVNLRSCNGADAVECAIKMSRIHTRRRKVLCGRDAWHGVSMATLALSSLNTYHRICGQLDVIFAEEETLKSLAELLEEHPDAAAVLLDPVGVANGLYQPETLRQDLQRIRDLCTKHGIVFILDEVQTFGGYIGDNLFASNHFGLTPDIICIGKALGAGLPFSATLCREDLRAVLSKRTSEYTYGGQTLGCVAAIQAIKSFQAIPKEVSGNLAAFQMASANLKEYFPFLRVHQIGFFAALARKDGRFTETWVKRVHGMALGLGVLVRNNHGRNILLKPPIIISPAVINICFAKLSGILTEVERELEQPISLYSDLVRSGVTPSPLTRIMKRPPEPSQWEYVGDLLAEISPALSVKKIDADQQARHIHLLRRAGIPVAEVYASADGVPESLYQTGVSLEKYMEVHSESDPSLVNGLVLQHQRYVEVAHDAGLSIPDRRPGNALVEGMALVLTDFYLAYCESRGGNKELLFTFEEIFSTFHCVACVKSSSLQQDLSNRLCLALVDRYSALAVTVWSGMQRFYSNPTRAYLPGPLTHDDYMQAIDVMSRSFRVASEISAEA